MAEKPARKPASDEDTFVVPSAWYRTRVPRRGSVGVGRPKPSATAAADAAALLAANDSLIRETLAYPATDPDLREAGLAHLGGRLTPIGAAAVAIGLARQTGIRDYDRFVVLAEAWFTEQGPVFAAEAVATLLSITLDWNPQNIGPQQPVRWLAPGMGQYHWPRELALRAGHRLRAFLAGVPESDHADVVAALAAHRGDNLARRVATSYLVPGRVDWVAADCAAVAAAGAHELVSTLMYAISTPEHYALIKDVVSPWWAQYNPRAVPTIAEAMGPAVAGILDGWFGYERSRADFRRQLSATLAALPGDEPFRYLLDRVDDKLVRPAVLDAGRRFPRRGLRLLAGDGRRVVTELLRTHVTAHAELAAELAPTLPPDARARVERILAESTGAVDASPTALPPVLAEPPWLRKRTAHKPVVIDTIPDDEPATVVWLPGERDRLLAESRFGWRRPETWEQQAERIKAGSTSWYDAPGFFLMAPEHLARPLVGTWQVTNLWGTADWAPQLAARFELDALPVLVDVARRSPATAAAALLPYGSTEIAGLMADWFGRLKSVRATAHTWFTRHAALSARVFVPDALSKPGPRRRRAEQVLRVLADAGHADEVRTVAAGYGAAAATAIDGLLDLDPVELLPARVPAVPAWADPAALPRIGLRTGGVLPAAVTAHVLTMLAMSRMGEPYAGLDQVRAVCEPADLAEFAWSLFRLWQTSGSPAKDGWVLDALALLGDDETVRRFTPVIRAWPGEGGHSRAVAGLDVLATIGTDVALLHLHGIAQKVKFRALRERAAAKIDVVADNLGLNAEQLADRLVPDLGLDPSGSLVLDYGPRQFTVRFDEQLKPYVVDAAGKRRTDLPKPAATDDPELAPAARQRFSALKKDARTVAADQIHRLERAMVTRRRWTPREFRELFVAHPLLVHVVQRLVWLVHDEDGTVTGAVRVAEDRSLADATDEPVTLPDTATVSVAHPMLLGPNLTAWAELFADYEILPPFPQLGREVFQPLPEERTGNLVRFTGRTVPSGQLLGLERHGWEREQPQDAGWQGHFRLELPDGTTATLGMDPGMIVGHQGFAPEQTVTGVSIYGSGDGIDPIVLSEIIRDVEAATG